ncbi:MAG: hypothetical protein A3K65_06670 [Euryarchaeota archaeon RBG_16_68_12]|nr:MAG: hypothetical protein A3K65_06670 [Euryarchaeota archaeon RBG_16_68_12]
MLVSFNGSRFDLPFVQARWPQLRFEQLHADLLYPLHKLGLHGGLKAIETQCGIERSEETRGLTGHDAVKLWKRWERGDDEALEVLLKYNEEDIVHLKPLADLAYRTLRARNLEPGRVDEPEDLALA